MLKLNCDMGESYGVWQMGDDKAIFPYIDMANLACGFHASDPNHINTSVLLAAHYNVDIGAHVSYYDLQGFGRRSIKCSYEEIKSKVIYQLGALFGFTKVHKTQIKYVKPHGALYNDMMQDLHIFEAIVDAISSFDANLKLMILSTSNTSSHETIATKYNIDLLYEVFADRNYTDDGFLVPRSKNNAVIHDINKVLERIQEIQNNSTLTSINGNKLTIKADTICVHSDTDGALEYIKTLKQHI